MTTNNFKVGDVVITHNPEYRLQDDWCYLFAKLYLIAHVSETGTAVITSGGQRYIKNTKDEWVLDRPTTCGSDTQLFPLDIAWGVRLAKAGVFYYERNERRIQDKKSVLYE